MVAFDPDILQLLQMKYKVEDVTFYIECTKENVKQMYDLVEVQGNCGVKSVPGCELHWICVKKFAEAVPYCVVDANFVKYMESVYSYVCANSKLEPGQGVELSAAGVILEVEKMQRQESQEIQRQIKRAKQMADDFKEVDDDKSEDWTPSKGCSRLSFCASKRGGETQRDIFAEPAFSHVYTSAKGSSKMVGKGKGIKRKNTQSFNPPPLATMKGHEEALLDAGMEGLFQSVSESVFATTVFCMPILLQVMSSNGTMVRKRRCGVWLKNTRRSCMIRKMDLLVMST